MALLDEPRPGDGAAEDVEQSRTLEPVSEPIPRGVEHAEPRDGHDLSADLLQPVLQSDHVTVQSYRKLRWGGRTGLLLEAA